MSSKTFTRRRFTLLLRRISIQHDLLFVSISHNGGQAKNAKVTSQCILNEQIPMAIYEGGPSNSIISLHILQKVDKQQIQIAQLSFDMRNQKILKPLSKQFFSKQFKNKTGYAQYKFIATDSRTITQQQFKVQVKNKNELTIRINQNKHDHQQLNSLMEMITEKDQIINKMDQQIQRLIKQTKRLNTSLSKQKNITAQQLQKNISLNVKFNPSSANLHKNVKQNANLWERQREQFQYQIDKLNRKIRDYESREKQYKQQINNMRKKMQFDVKDNQKKISDLRKQIEQRYQKQNNKNKRILKQDKQSSIDSITERQRKNKYIEQQLNQHLRKIQIQKQKQFKKQNTEKQLTIQLDWQLGKEKERQREIQRQKQYYRLRQKQRQRQRQKSRSYLRESSAQHRQFIKQINQLEDQKQIFKERLQIKDQQIRQITAKLEKAQKQIGKLQDQNIQLRKVKGNLLREAELKTSRSDVQMMKNSIDRQPIQQYQKMIIKQRKLIVDQKLRAQIDQLKSKIKKDQKQFRQKLQQKDMQLMRIQLSEKSANRQKDIYAARIKQMMENVQGDRKSYLQALQNAHKYESQQARTKQLEIANNQLETNNYKLSKQKQQIQNAMKKLKSKLEERDGQWVRLKSIQAQHDYYRNQCQKFEKAYKKFEKQYQSIKQYCQNLEHLVGKKPRKTIDQDINSQRQQRYKNQVRSRLEVLVQQVKEMQNKFYLEQIQIWLTQRTNIIHYYAKKFEEQKARILDMENLKQDVKNNLITQKQKQLNELKDNQIGDVDRKIGKLKLLIRAQDQKTVNSNIDKASFDQTIIQITQKIEKLKNQDEAKKKQLTNLKQKIAKLEAELKQKKEKMMQIENQQQLAQKRSLSLFSEDKEKDQKSKPQQLRKSYLQQFKKSRDLYMNKPFEELKKLNAELQADKRKVEMDLNQLKFNFDKQRVQLNDKIRTKQRQVKKLQNQTSTHQKTIAKYMTDIDNLKKSRDQLQGLIKRMRQQIKQISKTLQLKQRQCSQALNQIKRMQKNLSAYEQAEKKMFDDVKKMKQKLQKRQIQMQAIMQQRNQKAKLLDIERVSSISKLTQKIKQLQFKLQRQITQSLAVKSQHEKITQIVTDYEIKLKDKQQQYEVLDEAFKIYKIQWGEKLAQYEQQNNILQKNIMQIANEIQKKQSESCEFQIKIEYCEKRQQMLKNIKNQIEQQNKELKKVIENITKQKDKLIQKIQEQIKSLDMIKEKAEIYIKQNSKLMVTIKQLEGQIKNHNNQIHQMQKQLLRAQYENKNLQTELRCTKQSHNEQVKRLQAGLDEKQNQLQRLLKQRSRVSIDEKGRKSSQAIQVSLNSPVSPVIQRKMTGGVLLRSNSLIQGKSIKNIAGSSNLIRKQSNIQPLIEQQSQKSHHQQLYFSKQGIQLNIIKPSPIQQFKQQFLDKSKLGSFKKQQQVDHSKVDIDLLSQQDPRGSSRMQSISDRDKNTLIANPNQMLQQNQQSMMKGHKPTQLRRQLTLQQDSQQQQHYQQHLQIQMQQQYEQQSPLHSHHLQLQQQQQLLDYEALLHSHDLLKQKTQQLQNKIQQLTNQRNAYLQQLIHLRHESQKQLLPSNQHITKQDEQKLKLQLGKTIHHEMIRKTQNRISPTQRSAADIPNQSIDKSRIKKINQLEKQLQEMRNKMVQYELITTQGQDRIKQLEEQLDYEQRGRDKLVAQLNDILKNLQQQVNNNKQLKHQMQTLQQTLSTKINQLQLQLQQTIMQTMKKDQALKQTMQTIQKLNKQYKNNQKINQTLQLQISNLNTNIQKLTKTININKNQYRKYQQQAQLSILQYKQKIDQFVQQMRIKEENISQLADRYMRLQQKIQQLQSDIKVKNSQLLAQRVKSKQSYLRRDQVLQQMKKFDTNKTNLLNRIGDLQIKLGQKNQQLKQLTKQSAITYKKYQIQIDTQKQQHALTRKKLKQRQQHITNLKMQIANYNQLCHGLEKEKNALNIDINKLQNQLKDIMKCYQQQLDQLHKDKLLLAKQVQNGQAQHKDNQIKIQSLNKEIVKRGREIKQLSFKLEESQNSLEKNKEKFRKQIGEMLANMEIKNDEYQKIKVQLERETEHYFAKECQFLADKQKIQKTQKQYSHKLQQYQKILQQLQQQLKQLQNRPSVEQWQQTCFQNQLYKNRIQQLQQLLRQNHQNNQQRIILQFKLYKQKKQKQIQDLQLQLQKYGHKLDSLQQNNYLHKKDNESMKVQLRSLLQQKIKIQKTIKQYYEDIKQLKDQLQFYKGKRIQDLNKLLNQTYD